MLAMSQLTEWTHALIQSLAIFKHYSLLIVFFVKDENKENETENCKMQLSHEKMICSGSRGI